MNIAIPLVFGIIAFILAYRFYGRFLCRVFGMSPGRPTPAVEINDGVDYVPTKTPVIFAHHFATIAGVGPIVGPIIALTYGYAPCCLWIILGAIFLGAVHDFSALFVSMRERGRSVVQVAKKLLGGPAYAMLVGFTIIMLALVTSVFLKLTAKTLSTETPLAQIGVQADRTSLPLSPDGTGAMLGSIAATSVVVITLISPIIGYLNYRKNISVWLASLLAVITCAIGIAIGFLHPIQMSQSTWLWLIAIYTTIAAGVPVWIVLQPRDFINVHVLYAGIAAMTLAVITCGLHGTSAQMPAFSVSEGVARHGSLWPFLFITIACGAISGFHSLVAGGTTSKQTPKEESALPVGYGSMLLEAVLSLCVITAIVGVMTRAEYVSLAYEKRNPALIFGLGMGRSISQAFGFLPAATGTVLGMIILQGFAMTSLDSAVRLSRYLLEELWQALFVNPPRFLRHYWLNSLLSVLLMILFALSDSLAGLWKIFGTANQLLAAMALTVVSCWLLSRKRPVWYTLIPAILMTATTFGALILLLVNKYLPGGNKVLIAADILLLVLAAGVILAALKRYVFKKGAQETPVVQAQ